MAHQVVWAKCSVDNPKTGEAVILKQGELLPDWVSPFTTFVLVSTGGVKAVPDDAPAAAPSPDPVRLTEHPPLDGQLAQAEKGTLAADAAERLAAEKEAKADAPEKAEESDEKKAEADKAAADKAAADKAAATAKAAKA